MAAADINVDTGLNITQITGLDKLYSGVRKTVIDAFTDGGKKALKDLSEIEKESLKGAIENHPLTKTLKEYEEIYKDRGKANTATESLGKLIAGRGRLNLAKAYVSDLGSEGHAKLAELAETTNRQINATRSIIKSKGAQYSLESMEQEVQAAFKEYNTLEKFIKGKKFQGLSASEKLGYLQDAEKANRNAYNVGSMYFRAIGRDDWLNKLTKQSASHTKLLDDIAKSSKITSKSSSALNMLLGKYSNVASAGAAGAAGVAIGNYLNSMAVSMLGSDKPVDIGRRERAKQIQKWSGRGGAALGAAIGFAIGGPIGSAILAAVGGIGSSWLGGSQQRAQEASYLSQQEATQMARYRGLYASTQGRGGWQFAKLVQEGTGGLVSAGSVERMAANAQEFSAALAFGGVSESQMIGLSMLPNYYAAMARGASQEELIQAYMADVQGMNPGLAQYATRLAGIPEDIRALAGNPVLANLVMGQGLDVASAISAYSAGMVDPYMAAQFNRESANRIAVTNSYQTGANSRSPYNYDPSVVGKQSVSFMQSMKHSMIDEVASVWGGNMTKRDLNININGEKVATVTPVYTEDNLVDHISYAAGNL